MIFLTLAVGTGKNKLVQDVHYFCDFRQICGRSCSVNKLDTWFFVESNFWINQTVDKNGRREHKGWSCSVNKLDTWIFVESNFWINQT